MTHGSLLFRSERRRFPRSEGSSMSDGSTTKPLVPTQEHSSVTSNGTDLTPRVTPSTLLTTNFTDPVTTSANDDKSPVGIIIAAILTVVLVLLIVVAMVCLMRKMGLWEKLFGPSIRRRSSTNGSRRPLDLDEPEGSQVPDHSVQGEPDDMFTIDDMEDDDFGHNRPDREEYFYDEVFGQSQFEDERTKNSVRQLVSESGADEEHQHDDELLDFDFETLGIKIDNYKIDNSRHRHV